jgi:hypothetical protein
MRIIFNTINKDIELHYFSLSSGLCARVDLCQSQEQLIER